MKRKLPFLIVLLALLGAALASAPAGAADLVGDTLRVVAAGGGVRVEWRAGMTTSALGDPAIPPPTRLVALRMAGDAPTALRVERLASVPYRGALPAAQQIVPQTAGGELRPGLASAPEPALPAAPVVVLREGRMRGAHIVVLAVSEVFAQDGVARVATDLEVFVPGAVPLQDDAAALLAAGGPFLTSATPPRNPDPGNRWRVKIAQSGVHSLTAAALTTAGVPLGDPAKLHLYRSGAEVALEQRGAGASLELRFYAPAPGDRWNAADTYWLAVEATNGLRMATRAVTSGAAPPHSALERGVWRDNRLYDSHLPGSDGDHWFAAELKTGPRQITATLTLQLTPTLPLAPGGTTLIVTGGAYTSGQHNLSVTLGGETQRATWSGAGSWSQTFTFSGNGANVTLELTPGDVPDGVEPDSVAWERPASLDVGGRGAAFAGVAGTWKYQLANTPAGRMLYDVTDAAAPVALSAPAGANFAFDDGPAQRQYLLAGPGTLFAPTISRGLPLDLTTPADVLYIAPAGFHSALAPLAARRQAQGHTVRVIDAQAIYDAWSYGQVAPDAIRDFLRYAAATWGAPPAAVTLVGDGTSDPLNYTGRNNTTFIPPYLAMVDPWMGETACEACFARLDGPDPTADPLPDLALGRLPVKSAAELAALVSKLISYETTPLDTSWRSRSLYVADNYRDASGTPDAAGDFAAYADTSAAQQPKGVEVRKLYYDPSPTNPGVPWRERDGLRARARLIAALNEGMGLVNFLGHSSQFQWATTDPALDPPYLLSLYDPDDLTNGPRQPIVLEMTCLTAAFQTPAFTGTTIDERLLLRSDGGAIAVWGPTGLGVAHGHDALSRGFYRALWAAPPLRATLGQLTAAGQLELFSASSCCQDTLATYALLGDPLTPARVLPAQRQYLPLTRR